MNRKQWNPKDLSGQYGQKKKISYPLPEFEPRIAQFLVSSLYLIRCPEPDVIIDTSIKVSGYLGDKSIGTVSRYDKQESP
jgi:hypothetical protein